MKSRVKQEENWEYKEAVENLRPVVKSWAKKTLEVARALYIAHEKLSCSGYRKDLEPPGTCVQVDTGPTGVGLCKNVEGDDKNATWAHLSSGPTDVGLYKNVEGDSNATWGQLASGPTDVVFCDNDITANESKSFKDFCEDVGIPYRTAKRWVSLYDPDKDRVLELAELKEYKEAELNTLFETVRKHRGKEPGWKPEKEIESLVWNKNIGAWTERVEGLYQAWLIEKGYAEIKVDNLISPAPIVNKYGQFGLFSFDYLDSLAERCTKRVEGKGAEDYFSLCQTYKSRIPEGVEVNTVMRIPVIVEAALDSLSHEQKKETVRLISEILLTLGGEDA